jgi:hypothetical protein
MNARHIESRSSAWHRKVHLDVLPAAPERYLETAARTHLSAR